MLFHKEEDHIRRYDDRRRGDRRGSGGGGGNGGGGDDEKGNSSKGPNRQNLMIMLLATVITLVVISYVMNRDGESATEISYNEFVQMVEQGTVEEVNVKSDRLEIHLKDSEAIRYTAITEDSTALTDRLLKAGIIYGSAGALDGILDHYIEELGGSTGRIVATGGLASTICPMCRHEIILDNNLLLKGLYVIYKKNKVKRTKKSKLDI